MPVFDQSNMNDHAVPGSHYGFSATRIEDLGASEYTLVAVAADVSGSVAPFAGEIERCVKAVVGACRRSPRADNLLLRLTVFDNEVDEVHGFRPLAECPAAQYDGCIRTGGATALHDAAVNAVESVTRYGADLTRHDYEVNAIVFVVTDGDDNASTLGPTHIAQALGRSTASESLESMVSVLVGVNVHTSTLSLYLGKLHKDAGFDRYVELGDADEGTLARLADFVSRSISAQSQALGSGAASPSLTF